MSKNKKLSIIISGLCGIFLLFFILWIVNKMPLNLSSYAITNGRRWLAQITAIETDLLKKWQENGSLKDNLAYNSKGNNVVLLQKMLSQDAKIFPEKRITGYYGNLTKNAVLNFQKEYGLVETGVFDTITKNRLNRIFFLNLCPEPISIYPDFLMQKVTKINLLPTDYIPNSLVNISDKVKTVGIACLRLSVAPYLIKMFSDAQQDGVEFMVSSGYRKPEIQKYLYDFWIQVEGNGALDEIAKPGSSEHQLGSTVDLTDASIGYAIVDDRFATSDGGKWLSKNAYKYGFILSYPKDKEEITGYKYEPWHWRFVGIDVATVLQQQNITYNESNFNMNFPIIRQK